MGFRMGGPGGPGGAPKKPNPETVKRVFATFIPYRRQLAFIVVLVLISALLGLYPPAYLRRIVDEGFGKQDFGIVTQFTLLTLLMTVASSGFSLWFGYLSVLVGQKIMRDLRLQLFDHLQGMSLRFFTSTRTGEIQSRLISDVSGVQGVLSDTIANFLNNVTVVISTLIAMILLDWRLTLLALSILPVFAIVSAKLGMRMGEMRKTAAGQNADLSATMQETLSVSGVLLTKTSGQQARTLAKFAKENEALTATQVLQSTIMRIFFSLIPLTFSLTPALVYWLAGYFMAHGESQRLTVGLIVAFTALQGRLFFPLTSLFNVQVEVLTALGLFERIFEYINMKQEIRDPEPTDAVALKPEEVRGEVSFENVSFAYDDDKQTLSEITFTAKPGQLVALVGHSGSGKTTLTYLIPRLYDADSGIVRIDGHEIKRLPLATLGQAIGVVTQETYLVHDTIRENLRYGRPDATDEQLIAAAQAAAIHDHIASLPAGYDTVVGERGYKLSGGEKQRIAIARAILKNPQILILDEATSALDTQSERLIQDALTRLSEGRTTFAIAHRLSTILAADLILVMEAGKIVERGTHSELLEQNGVYAQLHAAQFTVE
ncbi:ABC transporter ATP-binding protein [Armatimonas rosea]|uniref:ATP-binding cassette subfamily B protein n=1 Tax=Armatimonas rosea TaxID=685828 RepID=A0A7W9SP39_ARMRO|nr:ABC transporter ATP-binding protein [Armatimonas rosea]MBB6050181.1 ATP-binding cassette subfamily B protein [Armatimonas rosea]